MGTLPSFVQELLLYASACARPTVELLAAALERSPLDAPLADAVDAGIVERDGGSIAFAHPLYRSAIYAESSREHRHRVHRRLSEVVDDGEERARHLALAADGPDEAAAAALEDAAGRARARGSTAAAAELCELAERLTPPERVADVCRLRGTAAEYRMLSGDYDTAFSLLESVVSIAPPGPDLAEALLRLGRALVIRDQEHRAVEVLTRAVRRACDPRRGPELDSTRGARPRSRRSETWRPRWAMPKRRCGSPDRWTIPMRSRTHSRLWPRRGYGWDRASIEG